MLNACAAGAAAVSKAATAAPIIREQPVARGVATMLPLVPTEIDPVKTNTDGYQGFAGGDVHLRANVHRSTPEPSTCATLARHARQSRASNRFRFRSRRERRRGVHHS